MRNLLLLLLLSIFANATVLENKWELDGFMMPESVVASPNDNWVYVSNVNSKDSGYISRLTKDGKIDNLKWITGLNNPAGLALFEDKLYIGDSSEVHIIDVKKGKLIKSIASKEAKALNDVTISKSGQVFISDIATGKIFTIKDDNLVVWFEAPEIKHPNGLYVQGDYLYVANFGSRLSLDLTADEFGSVYKVNLSNKSYHMMSSTYKLGTLDGLISFGNTLLVTSGTMGELYRITKKERVLVGTYEKGLADISIQGETLYAPFIFNKRIISYKIKDMDIR